MSDPLGNGGLPEIEVVPGDPAAVPVTYAAGMTIPGLSECRTLAFVVRGAALARVFIDDTEVHPKAGGRYEWTPEFVAGRVEVVVCRANGPDAVFHLEVTATESKLAADQYDAMVEDIRRHRAALLLDSSAASMAFGSDAAGSSFDALARFARLTRHGPAFLRQVESISRRPHETLRPTSRTVPLARAKRLQSGALRDPRIARFAQDPDSGGESLSNLWVATPCLVPTFDSQANRALKALMGRMAAQISALLRDVRQCRLGGDREEQERRRPRREQRLQPMLARIDSLLGEEPFASVSRAEITAASLVQISAQPEYSGAYRNGMRALWMGFEGGDRQDHLPVKPTWGVYEAWCFVRLLAALSQACNGSAWKRITGGAVKADESYELRLGEASVALHFQASFPALSARTAPAGAWSLSRQRYPDIVVVLRHGDQCEFIALDAKYRRHRNNVLEAMESAHIYHDALRIGTARPAFCALLLPAEPDVQRLEDAGFLAEHGVGTFSEFSPGGKGVDRCVQTVAGWVAAFVHRNMRAVAAA